MYDKYINLFLILILFRVHSNLIDECCKDVNNHTILFNCVNTTLSNHKSQNSNVVMAIFASKNIIDYAAHSFLVMGSYANRRGYSIRHLSESTGDDFCPEDRRWNKIKSVIMALDQRDGWAKNYEIVAYIDADLIILDSEKFKIEKFAIAHPNSDLIMSADALDVANTGFMIIRNTQWVYEFFQNWWAYKDSALTFCDQHVFNKLYAALGNMQSKITILDAGSINSRWPAIETFKATDRVLHLMGETHPYRLAVMKHASASLCSNYNTNTDIDSNTDIFTDTKINIKSDDYKVRLKFSKNLLRKLARDALLAKRAELLSLCKSENGLENKPSMDDFQKLHEATVDVCDDRRQYLSDSRKKCLSLFEEIYQVNSIQTQIYTSVDVNIHGGMEKEATKDREKLVFHYDQMTKILFDLVYFSDASSILQASTRFQEGLDSLAALVDLRRKENIIYIEHKRAILFGYLARHHQRMSNWTGVVEHATIAVDVMGSVLHQVDQDAPDFSGFLLQYIESCTQLARAYEALEAYPEGLHWANLARVNAQSLFKEYPGEERLMIEQQGRLYLLEASLLEHMQRTSEARHLLDEAISVLKVKEIDDNNYNDNKFHSMNDESDVVHDQKKSVQGNDNAMKSASGVKWIWPTALQKEADLLLERINVHDFLSNIHLDE